MSLPPGQGPLGPPPSHGAYVPPRQSPMRTSSIVVLSLFGAMLAGGGFLVLLCGGLGYVMTGTGDTGAGAMLVVGLLVMLLGVALIFGALFTWSRD